MVDKYLYTRQRAVSYAAQGLNASAISRALATEGLPYSSKSVSLLLRMLKAGQTVARKRGTGRPSNTSQRAKDLIEEQMHKQLPPNLITFCKPMVLSSHEVLSYAVAGNWAGHIAELLIVS